MIDVAALYRVLVEAGVVFFTGVPDSLLADFTAYLDAAVPRARHLIAANEGGAVAAAAGHYLATGRPAAVYLQNSGQGNLVNPIASLLGPELFGIPLLLFVGWRGEPGSADEPQHRVQGRITRPLFDLLDVPAEVLPSHDDPAAAACVLELLARATRERTPVAAIVRRGTFRPVDAPSRDDAAELTRERAVEVILDALPPDALVVCTTGMASRELSELRDRRGEPHDRDVLVVGAMGHASQFALGLALGRPERQVLCLDGDGAAIMHMGGLAAAGTADAANFKHVILNNGAHDSVGGQVTAAPGLDFAALARVCRYREAGRADGEEALRRGFRDLLAARGPALLDVRLRRGARTGLGRPRLSPAEHVHAFRRALGES